MTSHLNYLVAQSRHADRVREAERERLARSARLQSSSAPGSGVIARLRLRRDARAARLAAQACAEHPGA
jgi:hypothetical protein